MTARRRARATTVRESSTSTAVGRVGGRRHDRVVDPTTARPMGSVPRVRLPTSKAAVAAARRAFEGWSRVPRSSVPIPRRDRRRSRARADELAELIALEVGMPEDQCRDDQVPVEDFRVNAELAASYPFEEWPTTASSCMSRWASSRQSRRGTTRSARSRPRSHRLWPPAAPSCEAVGGRPAQRVRARGDRPRGRAPARRLQPGSGDGPTVGEPLVAHPDVDMVSFTGSTRAGKRVGEVAMQRVARVALELGGKSPLVVLDDADLETAVDVRRARLLHQLGADVQRADPDARAARPRCEAAAIAARVAATWSSAIRSTRAPSSGRWSRAPSATGCSATSGEGSPRAPPWSPAGRRSRRTQAAATS